MVNVALQAAVPTTVLVFGVSQLLLSVCMNETPLQIVEGSGAHEGVHDACRDALQLAVVPPPLPTHDQVVVPPAEGNAGDEGETVPASQNGLPSHPDAVDA